MECGRLWAALTFGVLSARSQQEILDLADLLRLRARGGRGCELQQQQSAAFPRVPLGSSRGPAFNPSPPAAGRPLLGAMLGRAAEMLSCSSRRRTMVF